MWALLGHARVKVLRAPGMGERCTSGPLFDAAHVLYFCRVVDPDFPPKPTPVHFFSHAEVCTAFVSNPRAVLEIVTATTINRASMSTLCLDWREKKHEWIRGCNVMSSSPP